MYSFSPSPLSCSRSNLPMSFVMFATGGNPFRVLYESCLSN